MSKRHRAASIVAKLEGYQGTFSVRVLGYEFPDTVAGLDADWLVVRAEWQGARPRDRVCAEGAILMADELRAWANALAPLPSKRVDMVFTEPNVRFRCSGGDVMRRANIALMRESGAEHETYERVVEFAPSALGRFGAGLRQLADAYPARAQRAVEARLEQQILPELARIRASLMETHGVRRRAIDKALRGVAAAIRVA